MGSIKIGQLLGSFAGAALRNHFASTDSNQTSAAAAKLLKESPLEVGNAPLQHMEADKLAFSNIKFPSDLGNSEQGHYMIFYTVSNKHSVALDNQFNESIGFSAQAEIEAEGPTGYDIKTLREEHGGAFVALGQPPKQGVTSARQTHNTVTSAVALFMPPDVKVSYKAENGPSELGLSGLMADRLGAAMTAKDTKAAISSVLQGLGAFTLDAARRVLVETGEAAGLGDVGGAISKVTGFAVNPFQEVVFEKMAMRTFSYTFKLIPRNKKEVEDINRIIKVFKYHMHPEIDQATSGRFMRVPSEFEIYYAYKDQVNQYLHKITRCVLTNCDVAYGGEQFATFRQFDNKGAASVETTMTLEFQESEVLSKGRIMEGY